MGNEFENKFRMKKLIRICCALINLLPFLMTSQTYFSPQGASWHLGAHWPVTLIIVNGYSEFKYLHDTTINSINCKLISGTYYGDLSYYQTNTIVPNYRQYYTYENNGVVFYYNGSNFDTVVNFKANIGDKWLWPKTFLDTTHYRGALTVVDTLSTLINNQKLKSIKVSYSYTSAPSSILYITFYQRLLWLGASNYSYKPGLFPEFFDVKGSGVSVHLPNVTFRCYEDKQFPNYNTSGSGCKYIVGLTESNNRLSEFKLIPNPIESRFWINLENYQFPETSIKATMTDVTGKHIQSYTLVSKKTEIDIAALSSGIYFLSFEEKGKVLATKKLIKN